MGPHSIKRVSITHKRIARNYYAVSLSEGGIFVRSVKPLPIGAKAEVLIKLKDGETHPAKRRSNISEECLYGCL